jgi:hypothetical protein
MEVDLPRGAECACAGDFAAPCCAEGLFCDGSGCHGASCVGHCVDRPGWGEPCTDQRECADEDAICIAGSGVPVCSGPPVGEERCLNDLECSPGRVCVSSYCLIRDGEICCDSSDCASGVCYGYGCGHSTCV